MSNNRNRNRKHAAHYEVAGDEADVAQLAETMDQNGVDVSAVEEASKGTPHNELRKRDLPARARIEAMIAEALAPIIADIADMSERLDKLDHGSMRLASGELSKISPTASLPNGHGRDSTGHALAVFDKGA